MRQASKRIPDSAEKTVRDIRRNTRRHHSAEEKIRIVLEGLRGEVSIAELCRKEGINQNLYYRWSSRSGERNCNSTTQPIICRLCRIECVRSCQPTSLSPSSPAQPTEPPTGLLAVICFALRIRVFWRASRS